MAQDNDDNTDGHTERQMKKLCILALTYKTFPAPVSRVHQATVDVLTQMDLKVLHKRRRRDGSARVLASGWRRKLYVELETNGTEATRARVLAKEGVFFADNAATELITRVAYLLEQGRVPLTGLPATGNAIPALAV
jgi:hypothetical protein